MTRSSIGCVSILTASCCGCCCGRLPTFGFGPHVDEAALADDVRAHPFIVDSLCTTEEHCQAVQGADVTAVPVGWNPLTGSVTALVWVEATCTPSTALHERLEPIVCRGLLGGWLDVDSSAWHVTEWALTHLPPDDLPRGTDAPDVDWDWD